MRMNTTLVVVATDAALTKAQARHLAVMAQDGLALAIHPVHTPLDGDIVFAAATGQRPLANPRFDLMAIGSAAAQVVARAIARGVFEAEALALPGAVPSYRAKFPSRRLKPPGRRERSLFVTVSPAQQGWIRGRFDISKPGGACDDRRRWSGRRRPHCCRPGSQGIGGKKELI